MADAAPTPEQPRPGYDVPASLLASSRALLDEYEDVARRTQDFAIHVADTMRSRPRDAEPFLRQCIDATVRVFQKWNLEILYVLSISQRLRFLELKGRLAGISSRMLSQKLGELEKAGLMVRTVQATKPLRVDYSLSEEGHVLARLTLPMVVHLNLMGGLDLGQGAAGAAATAPTVKPGA